uniref:2-hydroxyacid dehydrogenase n=1 Tax=Orrella sp. TaxID=1921583 RepID=UPI0040472E89
MAAHVVAVIDDFQQKSLDTIAQCLPKDWVLRITASNSAGDVQSAMAQADIIFLMGKAVTAPMVQASQKLRFIQKLGAGVDNIDLQACKSQGVVVAKLHGGNAVPVAEHTLLMTLATLRRLPQLDRDTRAGLWVRERARTVSRQLSGKTVGIVGFGAIGRAYARLLRGFDAKVNYFDIVEAPPSLCRELNATHMDFDALLSTADIVSVHTPLTEATRHRFGAREFALMKPSAVFINCARGGIVDEVALLEALKRNVIHGAGIDVFAQEPTPQSTAFFTLDNCVVTPHTAGGTVDNFEHVVKRAIDNVQRLDQGQALPEGDRVV